MEEIRRIPDPVSMPQPVGSSSRKQPGKNRDEFKEILERKEGSGEEREPEPESRGKDSESETGSGKEGPSVDADRGTLLDERA